MGKMEERGTIGIGGSQHSSPQVTVRWGAALAVLEGLSLPMGAAACLALLVCTALPLPPELPSPQPMNFPDFALLILS